MLRRSKEFKQMAYHYVEKSGSDNGFWFMGMRNQKRLLNKRKTIFRKRKSLFDKLQWDGDTWLVGNPLPYKFHTKKGRKRGWNRHR